MESSNLPLRKWVIGIYLMTTSLKGVSSMMLHRDLNITRKSAWFTAQRIRESWMVNGDPLDGEVEVGETYMGGRETNKHPSKRRGVQGPSGKMIVVGAKQRGGDVRAKLNQRTDSRTLHGFVEENVGPGSTVCTNEYRSYRRMPNVLRHAVRHSVGNYVDDQAHVDGLESFWAMLKRAYHSTFHHFSRKHLDRYVSEFSGRANARDLDTLNQLAPMGRGMVGRRLTYRSLTQTAD